MSRDHAPNSNLYVEFNYVEWFIVGSSSFIMLLCHIKIIVLGSFIVMPHTGFSSNCNVLVFAMFAGLGIVVKLPIEFSAILCLSHRQ